MSRAPGLRDSSCLPGSDSPRPPRTPAPSGRTGKPLLYTRLLRPPSPRSRPASTAAAALYSAMCARAASAGAAGAAGGERGPAPGSVAGAERPQGRVTPATPSSQ